MFKYKLLFNMLFLVTSFVAADELHDPTLPSNLPITSITTQASPDIALSLSATWVSDTNSRATINGNSYRVGQLLAEGSRLVKIRSHYVIVKQNGVSKKIDLVPSIKNPGR